MFITTSMYAPSPTKAKALFKSIASHSPIPEMVPKIYQRQMAAYKAVLKEVYPDKTIKCFLLWTDIAELMEIPDELLNKFTFNTFLISL